MLASVCNWNLSFFPSNGFISLSLILNSPRCRVFQQCTIFMAFVELGCKSSLGLALILTLLLSTDLLVGSGLLKSDQLSTAFILWPCPQHLLQICLTHKENSFPCFVQNHGRFLHTFKPTVQDKCKPCSVLKKQTCFSAAPFPKGRQPACYNGETSARFCRLSLLEESWDKLEGSHIQPLDLIDSN